MNDLVLKIETEIFSLRDKLERLLENSQDETLEKKALHDVIVELKRLFITTDYSNIELVFDHLLELSENAKAFGNGNSESLLLRFCLLAEQLIETRKLGVDVKKDYFHSFLSLVSEQELAAEAEDNINHASITILRTLYQRELLALIRNQSVSDALKRLQGVVSDLIDEIPNSMKNEWRTLNYYLSQISVDIYPVTHQILGLLDRKLASLLHYQPIETTFLNELQSEVKKLPDGKEWLENELERTKVYISAGVYSRLVNAMRDEIVSLHEDVESLYLDKTQVERLVESIDFLERLEMILTLMGFNQLASLTHRVTESFQEWMQNGIDAIDADFYRVVNYVWVLEENLMQLWKINDEEVPVTSEKIAGWALNSAKRETYHQLSLVYENLNEKLDDHSPELESIVSEFQECLVIEQYLEGNNPLLDLAVKSCDSLSFTQEELSEIIVAFAYIASRNITDSSIADALIKNAEKLLTGTDAAEIQEEEISINEPVEILNEDLEQPSHESLKKDNSDEIVTGEIEVSEAEIEIGKTPVIAKESIVEAPKLMEENIVMDAEFPTLQEREDVPPNIGFEMDEGTSSFVFDENLIPDDTQVDGFEFETESDSSLGDFDFDDDSEEIEFNFDFEALQEAAKNIDKESITTSVTLANDGFMDVEELTKGSHVDPVRADKQLDKSNDMPSLSLQNGGKMRSDEQSKELHEQRSDILQPSEDLDLELDLDLDFSLDDDIGFEDALIMDDSVEDDTTDGELPVVNEILLAALAEETTELEEIYKENIQTSNLKKGELQELVRVAHTLKANVKLIGLDDVFKRLNQLEQQLLGMDHCDETKRVALKDEFAIIFMQIKVKLFDSRLQGVGYSDE